MCRSREERERDVVQPPQQQEVQVRRAELLNSKVRRDSLLVGRHADPGMGKLLVSGRRRACMEMNGFIRNVPLSYKALSPTPSCIPPVALP